MTRPRVSGAVALAWCAVALLASGLSRERRGGPGQGGPALGEERWRGQLERAQRRIRAKRAAVLELLAQRLTLRQAAARFQELDAGKPERALAPWRAACPGNTDEERYCWTVLRFVGPEVRDDPVRAGAVRQRLEAELPCHLRRRLPDAPAFPGAVGPCVSRPPAPQASPRRRAPRRVRDRPRGRHQRRGAGRSAGRRPSGLAGRTLPGGQPVPLSIS